MLSSAALRALKAVTPLAKDALRLICMVCSFTVSLIITMVRCVCHAAVILITSVVRVSLIYATTLFIEILVTAVLLNGYFLLEGILTPYKHRLAIASFALETIQRMFHLAVLWLPGLAVCAWELRKSITSTLSSFYHKYTRPTTAHSASIVALSGNARPLMFAIAIPSSPRARRRRTRHVWDLHLKIQPSPKIGQAAR